VKHSLTPFYPPTKITIYGPGDRGDNILWVASEIAYWQHDNGTLRIGLTDGRVLTYGGCRWKVTEEPK
jgi:hypothetical protein